MRNLVYIGVVEVVVHQRYYRGLDARYVLFLIAGDILAYLLIVRFCEEVNEIVHQLLELLALFLKLFLQQLFRAYSASNFSEIYPGKQLSYALYLRYLLHVLKVLCRDRELAEQLVHQQNLLFLLQKLLRAHLFRREPRNHLNRVLIH